MDCGTGPRAPEPGAFLCPLNPGRAIRKRPNRKPRHAAGLSAEGRRKEGVRLPFGYPHWYFGLGRLPAGAVRPSPSDFIFRAAAWDFSPLKRAPALRSASISTALH